MRNIFLLSIYMLILVFFAGCSTLPLQERSNKLLNAAYLGNNEMVKKMLDSGVPIGVKDKFGNDSLHLAIKGENLDTAALLISRGANVNQVNALGDTPLHLSIYTKQKELTNLLRSKGASDDILNQYGLNPKDMELLPETEVAVAKVIKFLSQKGEWIDQRTARTHFDELKRYEHKFLINALVLKIINSPSVRPQTIILAIKLGIQGSEVKLGAIIMTFGTVKMAEDYLNSGSSTLHQWASKWASAHGYNIQTIRGGAPTIRWGAF